LKKIINGGKVFIQISVVRYQLDMLKKEWNAIGEEIKTKKKANKADPCEKEL
jgi:hypothetical protein